VVVVDEAVCVYGRLMSEGRAERVRYTLLSFILPISLSVSLFIFIFHFLSLSCRLPKD